MRDKNAKHLCHNAVATFVCVLTMGLIVAIVVNDGDLDILHAVVILIAALGASWFSCGIIKGMRGRRSGAPR